MYTQFNAYTHILTYTVKHPCTYIHSQINHFGRKIEKTLFHFMISFEVWNTGGVLYVLINWIPDLSTSKFDAELLNRSYACVTPLASNGCGCKEISFSILIAALYIELLRSCCVFTQVLTVAWVNPEWIGLINGCVRTSTSNGCDCKEINVFQLLRYTKNCVLLCFYSGSYYCVSRPYKKPRSQT